MATIASRTPSGEVGTFALARVVGIDPGLNVTGYAVVEPGARGAVVIEAGVIRTRSAKGEMGERLTLIHAGVLEVLDAFQQVEQLRLARPDQTFAARQAAAQGALVLGLDQ